MCEHANFVICMLSSAKPTLEKRDAENFVHNCGKVHKCIAAAPLAFKSNTSIVGFDWQVNDVVCVNQFGSMKCVFFTLWTTIHDIL